MRFRREVRPAKPETRERKMAYGHLRCIDSTADLYAWQPTVESAVQRGRFMAALTPTMPRLAPAMLPLKNQVYIATDGGQGLARGWPALKSRNMKTWKPLFPL